MDQIYFYNLAKYIDEKTKSYDGESEKIRRLLILPVAKEYCLNYLIPISLPSEPPDDSAILS